MIDEKVHCGQCEYLAIRRLKETAHIFTTNFETATSYAGDHIVILACFIPECTQALHAGDLVPSRAVILCQFCLDQGTGAYSSGTKKSGFWSKPGTGSARLASR